MARKPAGKATESAAAPAGGSTMIMLILQIAGFAGAAIALTVMVAGMHDLGFVDLTHSLHAMIVPMLVLTILSMSLYAFASGRAAAAKQTVLVSALSRQKDEFDQKIAATEGRLESYLGPAHAALIEENEGLKAKLEGLRAKNVELQEQINTWAVGTVDAAMTEETRSAA